MPLECSLYLDLSFKLHKAVQMEVGWGWGWWGGSSQATWSNKCFIEAQQFKVNNIISTNFIHIFYPSDITTYILLFSISCDHVMIQLMRSGCYQYTAPFPIHRLFQCYSDVSSSTLQIGSDILRWTGTGKNTLNRKHSFDGLTSE